MGHLSWISSPMLKTNTVGRDDKDVHKNMLSEEINVDIIYYDKKKDAISVEFDFSFDHYWFFTKTILIIS